MPQTFYFNLKIKNTRPNEQLEDELFVAGLADALVGIGNPYVLALTVEREAESFFAAMESTYHQLQQVIPEIQVLELEYRDPLREKSRNINEVGEVGIARDEMDYVVADPHRNEDYEVLVILGESEGPSMSEIKNAVRSLDIALGGSPHDSDHNGTRPDVGTARDELATLKKLLKMDTDSETEDTVEGRSSV